MSYYDCDGAASGDSVNAAPRPTAGPDAAPPSPKPVRSGACPDTRRSQLAGLKRRAALRARDAH